ncbi:DUF551 domain-containing protein [Mesorhizobium sp. BR1-1-6]|uniref:DUF551 domain-containing protein n=1 Tax=Mesorhizobium sp. BR1-1-6 TaxID=2876648 RepID=UPI001CD169E1|nr:DUF551 domain-containing protein [Mesorhizobium sp. BR1-1-6]
MPIETAPKDGRRIQLFCPSRKQRVCCGKWRGKFICQNGRLIWQPTHWQPLPNPPSLLASSSSAKPDADSLPASGTNSTVQS